MIYTCTLNPSLDYFMEFPKAIKADKTNRSNLEYYKAGGKGVNVSIMLSNLKIPSKAVGFLGGFTYDYYISQLEQYEYLQPNFVIIKANTRINLKAQDPQHEFEFNALGPHIEETELANFSRRLKRINSHDYFVLSGSIQPELHDYIKEAMKVLCEDEVSIVLDTNIQITNDLLVYKPLLIKPNVSELSQLLNRKINNRADIIQGAKELLAKGAQNIIVSNGAKGSYFINSEMVLFAKTVDQPVLNNTGCGDSMIAGFLFNLQRGADFKDCFIFANAASNATAFNKGFGSKSEILALVDQIEIEVIE